MVKKEHSLYRFEWKNLGDIAAGRPNLGDTTHVAVYRLMQYTLRDVLVTRYGLETASEILREAGRLAGSEFCGNMLDTNLDFNGFIADLQDKLRTLNVGIFRIEKADLESLELVMTISEDLDCSGLPMLDDTICEYDEGFLAGIFKVYTGKEFNVREVDCWASGERTCRFAAKPAGEGIP
ncbi:MAG TPA: 4-vinyl reductase [Geobacteraceae bacterium]|nr:4-vinyl reductase [Geobacteraceae bacterium]